MKHDLTLPALEDRFLPAKHWDTKDFINPKTNHHIFYRTAKIENPKGIIFCLPGLSEFGEKYIETATFFNQHGYDVVIIDWLYQGFSTRFADNPHKRHSNGYDSDVADIHQLITLEKNEKLPHYMFGHSMGGHIGLKFLSQYPDIFKAAAFSAPMLNIKAAKYIFYLTSIAAPLLKLCHDKYIPGGHNWKETVRNKESDVFSNDPVRRHIHNQWCLSNPSLQVGSPTYTWLYESLKSIISLRKKQTLRGIKTPIVMACAGQEELVDNATIKRAVKILDNATLINLKESKHEILVETDKVRDPFLNATLNLFNQSN